MAWFHGTDDAGPSGMIPREIKKKKKKKEKKNNPNWAPLLSPPHSPLLTRTLKNVLANEGLERDKEKSTEWNSPNFTDTTPPSRKRPRPSIQHTAYRLQATDTVYKSKGKLKKKRKKLSKKYALVDPIGFPQDLTYSVLTGEN